MWPNSYSACPTGCRVADGYVQASNGLGARAAWSAGLEPVFQPADAAQGKGPGGWAKQRAGQPHPRETEAAEKGEPGAACLGTGGHPTMRNRRCITHQPGRRTTSKRACWPSLPRAVSRSRC
jgi:hypothetical protein